jgi:hypothetical protein
VGNAQLSSAGSGRSDLLRGTDSGPYLELVYDTESARIATWRNVVIQSIHVADLAYVQAFGAVVRRQLRVSPSNVVSLALLHSGMKPGAKDVRSEMTRILRQTEGRVRNVLVIEGGGVLQQMLITVCRGVLLIAGKRVVYSLHTDRNAAMTAAIPHVEGREREAILMDEMGKAIALCIQPR